MRCRDVGCSAMSIAKIDLRAMVLMKENVGTNAMQRHAWRVNHAIRASVAAIGRNENNILRSTHLVHLIE